eukprot:RCo043976
MPAPITEILPGKLYLGNVEGASSAAKLNALGITHVVNAALDLPNFFSGRLAYFNCNLRDDFYERIQFDGPLQFIHNALHQGGVVLVHCRVGASRSAAIVVAYLMVYHRLTLKEILGKLERRRPCVDPNGNYMFQLMQLQARMQSQGCCARCRAPPLPGQRLCNAHFCPLCGGEKSEKGQFCSKCPTNIPMPGLSSFPMMNVPAAANPCVPTPSAAPAYAPPVLATPRGPTPPPAPAYAPLMSVMPQAPAHQYAMTSGLSTGSGYAPLATPRPMTSMVCGPATANFVSRPFRFTSI